jgi:hypothetical protein
MRVLPETKEEWMALLFFPFKAYVVILLAVSLLHLFPPIGKELLKSESARMFERILADNLLDGYILCIPFLVVSSFVQLINDQQRKSLLTMLLAFAPIILFLLIPFTIESVEKIYGFTIYLWHRYCNLT